MSTFSFFGKQTKSAHEMQIPDARLARLNASLKRRLDDDVEEVFHRACASNDLTSAADLLALMEKWQARRSANFGRERRISSTNLQRARKDFHRLVALHEASNMPNESSETETHMPGPTGK